MIPCPCCEFQDGLGLTRTQAQILVTLYAADPGVPVSDVAIMAGAGRSHRPDVAHVHISAMRKVLGSGAILTLPLAGWYLSPAMRSRCETVLYGPDECDTPPRRLDGSAQLTQG